MDRQNRRGIGALHSTGLLRRRPHNPPPPCACGCDFYQPDWLTRTDRTMAIVSGSIDAGAGEGIPFTDGCDSGETVRLHAPGIYYAAYTLHIPDGQTVDADLFLQLDGCMLPEGRICAAQPGTGTLHACAQAMFSITQPADLRLVTAMPLQVACDDTPLITLAVFRIG